jgi:hypothetical protein
MGLPKLNSVEYFGTLPISQIEVKYRPFNVKEQKILLQALEEGQTKGIANSLIGLIESCAELQADNWQVEDLSNTDLEWLFVQIRMKSVGETTQIRLGCKKQSCDGHTPIEIEFDKMEIEGELRDNRVMLTDEVGVVLRFPSYTDMQEIYADGEVEGHVTNNLFEVLNRCIIQVFDGEEVHEVHEFTAKEVNDFVDNLQIDQFNIMMDWFGSVPKMVYKVDYECEECSLRQQQTLEGLQNFFV